MDFLTGLRVVQGALVSNFWGLGCPIYGTQPSFALLLLTFLLGALAGLAAGAFLIYHFGLPRGSNPIEPFLSPARARLQGYAYARR